MHLYRCIACTLAVVIGMLVAHPVAGQKYPHRPIRLVSPAAGGGGDFVARLVAQGLTARLGQRVVVDNRPGVIAAEIVAKAPPDGYTLLLYASPLWLLPLFQDNISWDPVKDFSPVTWATNSPNLLVVHPAVPALSVKELINLAKTRPGELNYASSTEGSSTHIAAEIFKAMAGVNIVRVPYKGNGPALNALLGGEVQLMFPNAGAVVPHIKAGSLRPLAITSAQPSRLFPRLPTVAASGLSGYESGTIIGIFAPARTPAVLITQLNQEIVRVLNRADVKEKLSNIGVEAVGSSPKEFAATIKEDMARTAKVIKDTGMRSK